MATFDEAEAVADALRAAAESIEVRQVKYLLGRMAKEWRNAARTLEGSEDDAIIELAGSIGPGMLVPDQFSSDREWAPVMRSFPGNGGWSLHVDDDRDPRGRYLNLLSPTSPVVVAK